MTKELEERTEQANQLREPSPLYLRVLYAVIAFLALLAVGIHGFAALAEGAHEATPVLIILLIGIAVLHWILITRQRDDFKRFRATLNSDVKAGLERVEKRASGLLASKVDVLSKRSVVLEAMAKIYDDAADRTEAKKAAGTYQKPEVIVLFGASSIQPRTDEPINSTDVGETPSEKLNTARSRAEKQGVTFERYVRLFDEKNFLGRSQGIRDAYLVWLKGQISLLTRSPLHTLFNARRAPRWKAIRSSVASDTTYVDILGDGESGFRIEGEQFAKAQKSNATDYISDTENRQPIIAVYNQGSVDKLEKHLEEMTALNNSIRESRDGE